MSKKNIYLDHNATTPLHPEVRSTMIDAMEIFGNPSSLHSFGRMARNEVEKGRKKVASFIGASPEEIIFVGSGSEANNTVLSIYSCSLLKCSSLLKNRSGIITTKIEHPCILETTRCLHDRSIRVSYLDVDKYGKISLDQLKDMISGETRLVSIMTANNEIGTIQNIREIVEIVHGAGAMFHTDAVQAVGKIPMDVRDIKVDFLTMSAHKIYGPKGIGALYIRKGTPFCPLIHGGHQERGRRAGTENSLGIIGLGKAIEMRGIEMEAEEKRVLEMKAILKKGLEKSISDIIFNGHPTDCLPNTLNVSFDGAEGESILLYLDLEGIAVSTGSACASGSLDPSHVLLATGVPIESAHGSIRFSMGRENTMEDIEYVLEKMPGIIGRIRDMSTVYKRS
jgi:cysteine desulfurase